MPTGLKRIYGRGHLHFLTFSCYKRLPFLKTAQSRDVFVRELGRLRAEFGFRIIGYVVMPEHVHPGHSWKKVQTRDPGSQERNLGHPRCFHNRGKSL